MTLVSNVLRVAAINSVGNFVLFLGKIAVMAITAAISIVWLKVFMFWIITIHYGHFVFHFLKMIWLTNMMLVLNNAIIDVKSFVSVILSYWLMFFIRPCMVKWTFSYIKSFIKVTYIVFSFLIDNAKIFEIMNDYDFYPLFVCFGITFFFKLDKWSYKIEYCKIIWSHDHWCSFIQTCKSKQDGQSLSNIS